METVNKLVSDRPVVVFSKNSCCMSHTVKSLLCDFGVNPTVYELDELPGGHEIEQALIRIGCSPAVPVVFIGDQLIGGANEVMSLHLKRNLIPMLRRAGALWV
ncbi:Monothiol glutaredoxin-S2, partial [Cucurbita argyrosperma subsp. sororia]